MYYTGQVPELRVQPDRLRDAHQGASSLSEFKDTCVCLFASVCVCEFNDSNQPLCVSKKFKDNQTGRVSGVLYENLTVIQPYRYVMGINQNDQARRRRSLAEQQTEESDSGVRDDYRPMANVSIDDITYRGIRTVGAKVLSAGHFQCDVQVSLTSTCSLATHFTIHIRKVLVRGRRAAAKTARRVLRALG